MKLTSRASTAAAAPDSIASFAASTPPAPERIEIRVVGPRGGERWVPLPEVAGGLQLGLF